MLGMAFRAGLQAPTFNARSSWEDLNTATVASEDPPNNVVTRNTKENVKS